MCYQTLNRFSCVALAGVATEYLLYGYAEGGLADINKVWLSNSLDFSKPLFAAKSFADQKVNVNTCICETVGHIAQKLGIHTEESRFSSEMVSAKHNLDLASPQSGTS